MKVSGFRSMVPACIFLSVVCALQVRAQTPAGRLVDDSPKYIDQTRGTTVDEAVRIALANNGELLAMKDESESASLLVEQESQWSRPSIGFESRQRVNGGRNRSMVTGSIPLELGGRRSARTNVARKRADFVLRAFEEFERKLAMEVRVKFGRALAGGLKLELIEEAIVYFDASYSLVKANVLEGNTAPLAENMMLVELNKLRAAREKEEGSVRISVLELKNLLGMAPEEPLSLKGDFEGLVSPLPSLPAATRNALESRPDLKVLQAAADYAEAKILKSESGSGLDAALNLGYERMTDDFLRGGDHMLIFGVRFLLPFGNGSRDEIEAAVLDRQAAERRLEFGRLVVRREVAAAFARYEFAVNSLQIYRTGVTTEAFRNLEVIRQSYEYGGASLIEYLTEQRRYVEYESSHVDAKLELYLADVELMASTNSSELIVR